MASVFDQLAAAARGHVGVDRRFLQSILDQGAAAPPEILRFARSPQDQFPINLDPLLVDLFRYFGTHDPTPEALDFYIDAIRRGPEEVEDSLVQGLLPFGDRAAAPLLNLYEELGEEQGSDIAFLLAALRVRDPKVLQLLLDRLEYDAADGAFCLGLYGDQAARPALEKMLSEVGAAEAAEGDDDGPELHREIAFALEQLDAPEPQYQPEPFDILAEYPERELPPFDVLPEQERLEMFSSPEADIRKGAAHSFFNRELSQKAKEALLELAKNDPDAGVRGESWASLSDATTGDGASSEGKDDVAIRDAMIAVLNDEARDIEERGGAAVGLYAVADRDDVRQALEQLYELGGRARIRALEAMWRSLWEPYGKYFARQLSEKDDGDPELLKQVLRGAGYFRLTAHIDKIQSFFDRDEPLDDLREDALFAYALAMPGQTTRGRIRGMLRKIDALAGLSRGETELVMFALDERLRLHGMAPVFEAETQDDGEHSHEESEENAVAPVPAPSQKVGRNDPCPCGSGKKYKKCHGLSA